MSPSHCSRTTRGSELTRMMPPARARTKREREPAPAPRHLREEHVVVRAAAGLPHDRATPARRVRVPTWRRVRWRYSHRRGQRELLARCSTPCGVADALAAGTAPVQAAVHGRRARRCAAGSGQQHQRQSHAGQRLRQAQHLQLAAARPRHRHRRALAAVVTAPSLDF
jgi:hypothetical protein